jgi:hypothetical protein
MQQQAIWPPQKLRQQVIRQRSKRLFRPAFLLPRLLQSLPPLLLRNLRIYKVWLIQWAVFPEGPPLLPHLP